MDVETSAVCIAVLLSGQTSFSLTFFAAVGVPAISFRFDLRFGKSCFTFPKYKCATQQAMPKEILFGSKKNHCKNFTVTFNKNKSP